MAARFWVGGTGSWDAADTTHWAASSGGAGGQSVPTTSDDVTFDGSSGGGTVTVTATANCLSFTGGAFTGTFDFNGQTFNCTNVLSISGTATRTYTLGASTINCGTWTATTVTSLTINVNTSIIIQSGGTTFNGGGLTYNEVRLTSNGGATLAGTNTFATLRRTNTNLYAVLHLAANQTVSTLLVLTGANATDMRMFVRSNTRGTQRTITCNGTITLTNVDFAWVVGAGSGTWSGTSVGNAVGNSGITFTTPVTRYWVGNGGNWPDTAHWSASSGGATGASMPICHDTAIFDANSFSSGSQNVSPQGGGGSPDPMRICKMVWTGVTNTPTFQSSIACEYYGDITFVAGMSTNNGAFGRTFCGDADGSTQIITMAGNQWAGGASSIDAGTQAISFADAFTSPASVNYISGTWSVSANVTIDSVFFNGSFIRTINMGTGVTWTLSGTSPWSGSSFGNVTINPQTSTIKLTNSSASNKSFGFSAGGQTYYNIWVATGSTGRVDFLNTCTINNLKVDPGRPIRFTAATTTTFLTPPIILGTAGNVIVLDSTSTTNFIWSLASGIVSGDYLTITDSTAQGGAYWAAGNNSTDGGGANSGWVFGAASFAFTISDGVTTSDSVSKAIGKGVADTVTDTDAVSKAISATRTDNVTTTDATAKSVGKRVNDTVTDTDAVSKQIGKLNADGVTTTDVIYKMFNKAIADNVHVADDVDTDESEIDAIAQATFTEPSNSAILNDEVSS